MTRTTLVSLAFAGWGCAFPVDDLDRDGFSVAAGDCDDLDPRVHPDRTDPSGDGVDQNCDGLDPLMEASGVDHLCVLTNAGAVACNGDNSHGQLEVPSSRVRYVQIAAGDFHTCALDALGAVSCWGDDRFGQARPPDEVFVAIEADANWSLGELAGGGQLTGAVCWGLCAAWRAAAP